MAWILGKLKCCFCNGKLGVFHSVHGYGIYESSPEKRTFFHMGCLKYVEEHPTRHKNQEVDLAVMINDQWDSNIKINKQIIKDREENIKKLQTRNFESMLPGNGE
jgi:hypothetical protein